MKTIMPVTALLALTATAIGLLAAIPPDRVDTVEVALAARDVEHWLIGSVEAASGGLVELRG